MPAYRRQGRASTFPSARARGVQHALLQTLPGRAIVVGLTLRLAVFLVGVGLGRVPAFLSVVDTVAGLVLASGAAYFLVRLLVVAKRRLLWRVRRKLILSYIFIGFIPAILIVAFFLLCGFLLFYNFSSYLVQSRLHALGDEARFIAQSAALEIQRGGGRDVAAILARKRATAAVNDEGLSIELLPVSRTCAGDGTTATSAPEPAMQPLAVGPWAHLDPPRDIPAWIGCAGFSGLFAYTHPAATGRDGDTHLVARAVAFPDSLRPGYGVIVDLLVNDRVIEQLRRETGVDVKSISAIRDARDVAPLAGRAGGDAVAARSSPRSGGLLNNLTSLIEYRDWATGAPGTLLVSTELSIADLYDRISAAQGTVGRSFGQGLLLVLVIIGVLFLIIEFIAFIAGLALAKSLTGSVHQLFRGTERVRQGDFTHKIDVTSDDQLGELAVSFNSMTASIEDLLRQAAEKKRLEEELRIAREIQMSLLPQGPLAMSGVSLTALCVPAREVGGDYYDFLRLGERRLGVLIADVSGKGTSAALYMAELKGLILSLSRTHTSPRELMLTANRIIAANLDARSFITMTYAVIDLDARTMTYARAGHTPLMYLPGEGSPLPRRVRVLAPDGLVLGLNIDNGETFERLLEEETIRLYDGDIYLFFTDGITEAMNAADDCFGETRLAAIIEQHADLGSDELRERVLGEIQAFVGTAPQHDDMTMILLKIADGAGRAARRSAAVAEGVP